MDEERSAAATATATDPEQSLKAAISREMVRLYKEQFGRGPTGARVDFAGADIVIATLEHSLTPAEKRLVDMGQLDRVRDMRLYFQHATEEQFSDAVERHLGREVRAFTSGIDVGRDVSSEVFYLGGRSSGS